MAKRFPNMAQGFPHGSCTLGLANIRNTRTHPVNSPHEIQELFANLEYLYLEIQLFDSSRRIVSSSDPAAGAHSNKNRVRNERLSKLYSLELRLSLEQEKNALKAEKDHVDIELASVLAEVQRLRLFSQIGDYIAILNQELRQDERMQDFAFKEHKFVTELIEKVRGEEREIAAPDADFKPATPIRDSLVAAYGFLTKIYSSPEQLIDLLGIYALRNTECHNGVKRHYDERNFGALHNQLVRDRDAVNSSGLNLEDRTKYLECIESVRKTFFRHFTWKVDALFKLTARAQLLSKDVAFDKDGNVKIGKSNASTSATTTEEARENRKERRAREKSIRDADKAEICHNTKADFEKSDEITAGLQKAVATSDLTDGQKDSQGEELSIMKSLLSSLQQQNTDLQYQFDWIERDNDDWRRRYETLQKTHEKIEEDLKWERKRREGAEEKLFECEGLSGLAFEENE